MNPTGMSEHTPSENKPKIRYVLAPFLLLVLFLGALNVLSWRLQHQNSPLAVVQATAVSTQPALPTTTQTAVSAASPMLTPTVSSATAPTLSPDSAFVLLGPPPDMHAPLHAPVTFYWQWTAPPNEEIRLAIYLEAAGTVQLLGELEEPNVGSIYSVTVLPETAVSAPGEAAWFVRAEHLPTGAVLQKSETRSLNLYDNPSS